MASEEGPARSRWRSSCVPPLPKATRWSAPPTVLPLRARSVGGPLLASGWTRAEASEDTRWGPALEADTGGGASASAMGRGGS